MSIDEQVSDLIDAGQLVVVPAAIGGPNARPIYAVPVIANRLLTPLAEATPEDRLR